MFAKDINETNVLKDYPEILDILLYDQTTKSNIIWATDNYSKRGPKYQIDEKITSNLINSKFKIIKPRVEKSKAEQVKRSRNNAEVFTPSWIINKQNNLVDNAWFEKENVFNIENEDNTWTSTNKVEFDELHKWEDYVTNISLEICCGEAPYIVSRYDAITGKEILLNNRVGLLDRKLRVINENAKNDDEWLEYTFKALKSVYGYELQGDNLLIARENILLDFIDYYVNRFNKGPDKEILTKTATIISWNIWQMDGLKLVVPFTCHNEKKEYYQPDLFGENEEEKAEICPGCKTNDPKKHNGKRCYIMDWEKNKKIKFISLMWRNGYVG